jgi:HemY protein
MAELEEMEHGDIGRAREWMGRALTAARDPVWTADGFVSDQWMPVSPVTGRLDAFEWKVPLAEIAAEGSLVEEEKTAIAPAVPAMEGEQPSLSAHRRKAVAQAAGAVRAGEPVIPLVHAPDDPGLEPEPPAPADGWRKLRLLFRLS